MQSLIDKYHLATGLKRKALWLGLIVGAGLFICYSSWQTYKKNKEVERLRIETEKRQVALRNVKYQIRINENSGDIKDLMAEYETLTREETAYRLKLGNAERDAHTAMKALKKLKTWNDLNAYNQLEQH